MPMFKTCTACKETFIAESPFIKLCPICNAKSQTTPAERAQRKTRITPDRLMRMFDRRMQRVNPMDGGGTKKPNAAAKRKKRNVASLRNARNGVNR